MKSVWFVSFVSCMAIRVDPRDVDGSCRFGVPYWKTEAWVVRRGRGLRVGVAGAET